MQGLSQSAPADVELGGGDLASLGAAFSARRQGLCQPQSPRLPMQGCPPLCGAPSQLAESPASLVTSHYLMDRLRACFGLCKCHLCRMPLERRRRPAAAGTQDRVPSPQSPPLYPRAASPPQSSSLLVPLCCHADVSVHPPSDGRKRLLFFYIFFPLEESHFIPASPQPFCWEMHGTVFNQN